jgi:prolyl-tRNA editing enzyme YbaK/EbsC (Cys-tRNA(Pro) deacylase)
LGYEPSSGRRLRVFVDRDLLAFDELWAAAGAPDAVFMLSADELVKLSGGEVAELAERSRRSAPEPS